jgi:hypothetical protein
MLPVTITSPQRGAGLTLFPLIASAGGEAEYDLLTDAIEAGSLTITEVGEQGTVPELMAVNRGPRDVLVLDGMQLIGAKQNRTVSRTILLAAASETRIPVSCMEQGRWRHATHTMTGGLDHSPAKVRRRTRTVESSEAASPRGDADRRSPSDLLSMAQGDVWNAIRESGAKFGAHSDTGALDDLYAAARPRLEDVGRNFPVVEGQVGFIAFLGRAPVGADVLDSAGAYARVHDRLIRGYVFEALEAGTQNGAGEMDEGAGDGEAAVQAFLDRLHAAARRALPTVGRGEYRSLAGPVVGGELELAGRVVHLSAFPA